MNMEKEEIQQENSLDSLERVKTLSPGMMVIKRFFRNKLAIVGLAILLFMVLFSFLGGLVNPYKESQVFRKTEVLKKDYAGATVNKELNVMVKEGFDYNPSDISMAILSNQVTGESQKIGDDLLFIHKNNEESYSISKATELAKIDGDNLTPVIGKTIDDKIKVAFQESVKTKVDKFNVDLSKYGVSDGKLYELEDVALASYQVFSVFNEADSITYDFRNAAETMIANKGTTFVAGGDSYEIEYKDDIESVVFYKVVDGSKTEFAMASKYIVTSVTKEFLDMEFKYAVINAIKSSSNDFTAKDIKGKETKFYITDNNEQYTIKREQVTAVNDSNAAPSAKHLVGTDSHGMDVLTRLMYGGRVSLLIGFLVVALEMIIGVILGGIAGYFGKWVDTLIMRIVEIFNCIPTMPLFIIIGTILDARKCDPKLRIYFLALVLAAFYWTGVARMVRGQILSLREQEFMIATEAMGIRTSKRIFKHLIPNVLPQLIVMATMDLGGIILTEASLSFLGLGVKFPLASWGQIINAVNDMQTMTQYWWVWIPAGICILLTVLGFNFIGDGLRDAFDPKMKR